MDRDCVNYGRTKGYSVTPLMHAAHAGNLPLVQLLLELGADVAVTTWQTGGVPVQPGSLYPFVSSHCKQQLEAGGIRAEDFVNDPPHSHLCVTSQGAHCQSMLGRALFSIDG